MPYETILTEQQGRVGIVTLNRPQALNALSDALMHELNQALTGYDQDDEIGCMVITGSEKAFAAGADIKGMAEGTMVDVLKGSFVEVWDTMRRLKKPLIAAVSGWALGGGCELAMLCDMIVASETAKFGQPEINLGIIPGAGGTQRLTRAVGKAIAMEMVLNDRRISAEEALTFGLINRVYPADQYLAEAIKLAQAIAERAPVAVMVAKDAINHAFETTLNEGIAVERRLFQLLFATEDQTEGMQAFVEKRKPNWQGK